MRGYNIRQYNGNTIYSRKFLLRHKEDKSILEKQVQVICNELTQNEAIEQIESKVKLELKENYSDYELI